MFPVAKAWKTAVIWQLHFEIIAAPEEGERRKKKSPGPRAQYLTIWWWKYHKVLFFFIIIFSQERPKYFVALKTIAKWNDHFPPNYFPSCSWPVFASIPNQQLDLPHFRWDSCSSFPFPAGPVSPSASQETWGSSGVAPGAPIWCHQHLGTSCPSWGQFQRVQVVLLTSIPKFLPLFPQEAAAQGWGHIPE